MLIKLSSKPIFIVAMLISLANSLETTESSSSSSSSSSSQVHDHDDEPILELYMHDILGGNNNDNNPTARPVTGLLGAIYGGRVPFSKPITARPSNGVVVVPASQLAGMALFFRTQLSPDGLSLGFGTLTVIDDILTAGPELGSQTVGRARGVYVASGITTASVMMAFTAVMEGGEYGDSLNFCGVYVSSGSQTTSRLAVVGGTGKFRNVRGFAEVRSLIPTGQHPETLLRIRVHLRY